jgi:hypothetical protein
MIKQNTKSLVAIIMNNILLLRARQYSRYIIFGILLLHYQDKSFYLD